MPRRRVAVKRTILPDPVHNSLEVAKFINQIMSSGKKSIAEKIVYGAFSIIEKKSGHNPVDVFSRALEHVRPLVEVKSRRVGGATYQVPSEIAFGRSMALARRWLKEFASKRSEKNMMVKLAGELLDAADEENGNRGKGGAVKKREDTHKMAEANKAFSHFRW